MTSKEFPYMPQAVFKMGYFIPKTGPTPSKSHNRLMLFAHGKCPIVVSLSFELPKYLF